MHMHCTVVGYGGGVSVPVVSKINVWDRDFVKRLSIYGYRCSDRHA